MGTRYGADYGELWCSEFADAVLKWISDDAPDCDSVGCFFSFYTFQLVGEQRISPEGYPALLAGDDARAALSAGVAEPGDYMGLSHGEKGSHSGLFLAHNPNADVVWHIGGNESGDRLCLPTMHQCGTSAVFISEHGSYYQPHDDGDYYHNFLGLNWWMHRD